MKNVLFASVLLLVLSSCNKSTSGSLGTITSNVDGTAISFNTGSNAIQGSTSGLLALSINGYQGVLGASNRLSIEISNLGSAFIPGVTYTDSSAVYSAQISY